MNIEHPTLNVQHRMKKEVKELGKGGRGEKMNRRRRETVKLQAALAPSNSSRLLWPGLTDTSPRFDRPFDKLMVLSNVEGLTALSESKGCAPSRRGISDVSSFTKATAGSNLNTGFGMNIFLAK